MLLIALAEMGKFHLAFIFSVHFHLPGNPIPAISPDPPLVMLKWMNLINCSRKIWYLVGTNYLSFIHVYPASNTLKESNYSYQYSHCGRFDLFGVKSITSLINSNNSLIGSYCFGITPNANSHALRNNQLFKRFRLCRYIFFNLLEMIIVHASVK